MSLERLKIAKKKIVGTKQTLKSLQNGTAKVVYVADDAEFHVTLPLKKTCQEKNVKMVIVESMVILGRACGIDVGSASAAIIDD